MGHIIFLLGVAAFLRSLRCFFSYEAAGQYLEQIRDCLAGNMPVYDQLLAETYIKFLLETKSNDHQILGRFKDLVRNAECL